MFDNIYRNKRVLVTGHTGFKGSWLTLWLHNMGAQVGGISLSVPTTPAHYELATLREKISFERFIDIKDFASLYKAFEEFQPEILFHLAAEPIVSICLENPKMTFDTNLGGTVNVLECIRQNKSLRSAVIVTSDKCYENVEWDYGYREDDRLGGKDPYSASKACAEIAFSAYFRSYIKNKPELYIASARAGNVIGGGDWAKDRIVVDCIRAISKNEPAIIRSPASTRPWQLVLEPLSGYLWLGAQLYLKKGTLNGEAFNFGPNSEVDKTVADVLREMSKRWAAVKWEIDETHAIKGKEAGLLKLSCDKALRRLEWKAVLSFDQTMDFLTDWYRKWHEGSEQIYALSLNQIKKYEDFARQRQLCWVNHEKSADSN